MKLAGREARHFLEWPDPDGAGVLLFGGDAMRVALKRQTLVAALIGPEGAAEMRLARIAAADLRRDPAALDDAVRGASFFPGPRAVVVEDAGDGLAELMRGALADWRAGDAQIVVTAGALKAGSPLRKVFEAARNAVAIGIYDDPPGREEIAAALAAAGLGNVDRAAMGDLEDLARGLGPGDFAQFLTKLALYKAGDPAPLKAEDMAACAPRATEADLDHLLDLVAEGQAGRLAVELRRAGTQGSAPVKLVIDAGRRFRTLLAAAMAPDGPEAALARVRPPVFGPRRARLAAQARGFGAERLETALGLITETDLALRSGGAMPGLAMVERLFVRVAMLRPR